MYIHGGGGGVTNVPPSHMISYAHGNMKNICFDFQTRRRNHVGQPYCGESGSGQGIKPKK